MQVNTNGDSGVGIDGAVAAFDMADDAIFVDHNVGAESPLVAFALDIVALKNAVRGEHFVIHIAEEWEFDADLLGESSVRGRTIHANTENFRIIRIDLARVDSRLDRLELFGSTTCEG